MTPEIAVVPPALREPILAPALFVPGFARCPSGATSWLSRLLILPQHTNHSTLNLHCVCCDHNRRHRCISRLQSHLWSFTIKTLESRFDAFDQCHDDLTVLRIFHALDHHVITVDNVFILHRVAANFEHENFSRPRDVIESDALWIFEGLHRTAGSDASEQRQALRFNLLLARSHSSYRQQIDRAAAVVIPLEEPLSL